jgi:histidyl-tRNA synthetase
LENGLLFNQVQKLWYQGPMFRHERPQKGRYRQFHQIGVESFGLEGPDVDLEQILITARIWKELGLQDLQLQINTLGSAAERTSYRDELVSFFRDRYGELDEDSRRRLEGNPLRILDSKNPQMAPLLAAAPSLMEHLGGESRQHFEQLCAGLKAAGQDFVVNPHLVRGLDYYARTVFEWVTDQLGAQGTVCAGGRYDGLVEQLGGKKVAAVGFAMGLERLIALLEQTDIAQRLPGVDVYLVMVGEQAQREGLLLAERLRDELPQLRLHAHCGGGSFKSQFKKADKSNASYALILGDDELSRGEAGLKPLRGEDPQQQVKLTDLAAVLAARL